MDQPKIERMLRLMKMMSSNVNYSINELSEKLGISYRTIYRYIDTFRDAGFVVEKIYSNVYKLGKMPKVACDFSKLIYFSEEEAYLVNRLIDGISETNNLKANLKKKLSAIYSSTSIAEYIGKKGNSAAIEDLAYAIRNKCKAYLRDYESGNSHSKRDRYVEPFDFTPNYIDVWAYDLEDGENKVFKINRIDFVDVTEEYWTEEKSHRKAFSSLFPVSFQNSLRWFSLSATLTDISLQQLPALFSLGILHLKNKLTLIGSLPQYFCSITEQHSDTP